MGTNAFNTSNINTFSWNTLGAGNTTTSQYNGYDPKIGANLSGVWEAPNKFLGELVGGTYNGRGKWVVEGNRPRLMHGTAHATTSVALEQITGGQISGLRDAHIRMANGQLVYAKGIDERTGAEVTYTRSSDGIETMTYSYGSWTAQLIKDKSGEWRVVGGSGPIDMNLVQRYMENLENSKAQMDRLATAFRSSEGISNADSQTFNAGYKLAYDIARGKGGASEYERGFARDLIRATEEAALTKLANEGKLSLEGKKIDEFEARKRMEGGVAVKLPEALREKLQKFLPADLKAGVDKVIATKDGYVVQDTKGHYWFFGKNESINDALRDAWKTTVSGKNKDFFNYRENATDGKYTSEDFRKDLTSFRSRASEYAATRAEELSRRISFARQNARDINARATQLLIGDYIKRVNGDDIRDKTGKALTELNHLVSSPQGIRELMEAADRVVDDLMKDRKLEKPDVDESRIRKAANEAEEKGIEAKGVEVEAPYKDAEQVYKQVRSDIERRTDRMGEEYQQSRKAVDKQSEVYENAKMNSPLENLPKLRKFDELKQEIEDLMIERNELISKVNEEEKALLNRDIPLYAKVFGMSKGEMLELIKDENRLKAYEEKVRNAPPYEQLRPAPNALWSFRKRWLSIQEMKQELSNIQQELDGKLREYEELKPYAQAEDLQQGNYEVKYRDDKGPGKHPQIETATEQVTEGMDKKIEDYKKERKTPEEIREEIKKELKEMHKRDLDAFKDIFG